jgi:hypothetical protein
LFKAQAIFYQHISMAQSHQLVWGGLKVVGANVAGHQRHYLGAIAGHRPGKDRDWQDSGYYLEALARGATAKFVNRAAACQQQGCWQEGGFQASLQASCQGGKRRRPRSSQYKHATAANGNHYH